MIYYYCSAETFQNIVKNKKLWLSDVTKSNDSGEISLFIDVLKEKSKEAFSKLDHGVEDYNFNEIEYYNIFCSELRKALTGRKCLTMCFSSLADDLSQWRAYGDDGRGFCIGFADNEMRKICNKYNLALHKVIYIRGHELDSNTQKRIKRMRNDIIHDIQNGKKRHDNIRGSIKGCIKEIVDTPPRIKDDAFSVEKETRIYLWDEIDKLEQYTLGVHFNRNGFVPYIELDVSACNNLIKEIYIGPTNNGDADVLQKFCDNYNLSADVKKSKIGYRCKVGGNN